jgi:hypothetical protein
MSDDMTEGPDYGPSTSETPAAPGMLDLHIAAQDRTMRLVWEQWASSALTMELALLAGESRVLGAAGALVLAQPRLGSAVSCAYDIGKAAGRAFDLLQSRGWSRAEILTAGYAAFAWLMERLPEEEAVKEAADFFDRAADDMPSGLPE